MKIAAALKILQGLRETAPSKSWKQMLDELEAPLRIEQGFCWILNYKRTYPDHSVQKYSLGPFKTKEAAEKLVIDEFFHLNRINYIRLGDVLFLSTGYMDLESDQIRDGLTARPGNDYALAIFDGFVEYRPHGGYSRLPYDLQCE